jgi:hypothetical protein
MARLSAAVANEQCDRDERARAGGRMNKSYQLSNKFHLIHPGAAPTFRSE